MGSAFCYRISKQSLQSSLIWSGIGKVDEQTLKEDLFKHFNSEIYSFEESEESFIISMRKDIPVNDFLELFEEFQKIDYKGDKEKEVCQNKIREDISVMKDIYEIWDSFFLADNKTISECEFESYDLFTDYLRFRLQHTKLADSMLIFLTE